MNEIITSLQNKQLLWQAGRVPIRTNECVSTGYHEANEAFAGGWPKHCVIAIQSLGGIGELRLVLPGLISQAQNSNKLIVFISPPWHVNAEMLHEQGFNLDNILIINPSDPQTVLWSAEQCLKSGCCAAVLLWPGQLQTHQVKRLQLACEQGQANNFIFSTKKQTDGLPFTLSLLLAPHNKGLEVSIKKRRGGWPKAPFCIDMQARWPQLCEQHKVANIVSLLRQEASS